MSDGAAWLLLAGPAGAGALYWYLYKYYRNTDKSHNFERETKVQTQPISGSDQKIDQIEGTQRKRIEGDNVDTYRLRVQRIRGESL